MDININFFEWKESIAETRLKKNIQKSYVHNNIYVTEWNH